MPSIRDVRNELSAIRHRVSPPGGRVVVVADEDQARRAQAAGNVLVILTAEDRIVL